MNEDTRRRAALAYLQQNHPVLSMRIASQGQLDGLGDFWSDLRDKTVGKVTTAVKSKVATVTQSLPAKIETGDAVGQAQSAGFLSTLLGPSTATALFNLYRIEKGRAPVQVSDVVGASKESAAIRFIPYAIGTALGLWGLSKLLKSFRG